MAFPVFIKSAHTRRISIQKEIREVNRLRVRFERGMARKLNSLFAKTARQAAQAIRDNGDPLAAIEGLGGEVRAVFYQQYQTVIDTFANRVLEGRKETFLELVDAFMRLQGADHVVAVTNTTRRSIRSAIRAARADGLSVDNTAKLVVEKTSGAIGRARASTIARTETHAAASYATDEATRQLDLPNQKKRWVAVGDARTRASHAAANGQEVPIDDPFLIRDKGSTIEMKYPHDGSGGASNNINCRCLAVYFSDDDALFDDVKPSIAPVEGGPIADDPTPTVERFVRPRDKAINAATLVIPRKADAIKEMQEKVAEANKDNIYKDNNDGPFVGYWRSRAEKDNGKVSLSGFEKTSVAYVNQGAKELDAIADWLGLSRIRGYKGVGRSTANGNQGGGIMALNKKAINGYVSLASGDRKTLSQLREEQDKLRIIYREKRDKFYAYRQKRGDADYDPAIEDDLFSDFMAEQKKMNDLTAEYSLSSELDRRGGGITSYQRGDPFEEAPWSGKEYFADGLDKTRFLMYHEFAHHVHQTYKLDTYYRLNETFIERRLSSFFSSTSRGNRESYAPSTYAMTNSREYFAESFAMYMMDKADDLHPQMIELIEEILVERSN